ncbi:MAG: electron transfer flavoprotein subunit alpha/FixB family protein [Candidatus Tectomicrobia bacterium]|nr:electron transfer flavoprotein subunit alpha/FixB family protein [Candidatus Tectomicrobia bacterium]
MTQGVLIFAETSGAALAPIAKEMCGVGRRLADALGEPLLAAVIGSGVGDAAQDAIAHGADRVYVADAEVLATYQTASYCEVLGEIAKQAEPEVLLVGMSDNGRDLGPRLAFRLRTGLASDCVDLAVDGDTRLLEATRPVSGGNAMATVVIEKSRPQMATVRAKTMQAAEPSAGRQGEVIAVEVSVEAAALPVTVVERVKAESEGVRLEDADVVISGGRGLKGPDDFYAILEPCAKSLGGAIGASRAAVDEGWVPTQLQVGLTGKIVSPKLYVACAISGAAQHMAGCGYSKTIVAVNRDPDAPIYQRANIGIVGDYKKVIPAFQAKCAELLG